ncbi:pectate lyase [Pleomorphovibrio marinus]|uniref:pectate lyase n=1 Tax=Pleomorphovibrio marinus TaxID=2164132 RepID=UPI000E0AC826|nr:pectate lyase [Pleomorphovibrio marinus]
MKRPFAQTFNLFLIMVLFLTSNVPTMAMEKVAWKKILDQPKSWYGGAEATRIANNILLFQKDNGGWFKNIDMSVELDEEEKERLRKEQSEVMGTTIDNDATFIQTEFLAKVYQETHESRFAEGVLNALDYLMDAQYENGGWPQYYPIREGYWAEITFNDGAMIQAMETLKDVAEANFPYDFLDENRRRRAQKAIDQGLEMILKAQIEVDGKLTAWCAQHDRDDLSPVKGRAYELPSISGGESVGVVKYLMGLEDPDERVIQAIESAVEWFEEVKIEEKKVVRKEDPSLHRGHDRLVVEDEDAGPLWARFYEIGTNRPMFVGRDGVVRYRLADIEHERRVGYSYLGNYAEKLLEEYYPTWKSSVK